MLQDPTLKPEVLQPQYNVPAAISSQLVFEGGVGSPVTEFGVRRPQPQVAVGRASVVAAAPEILGQPVLPEVGYAPPAEKPLGYRQYFRMAKRQIREDMGLLKYLRNYGQNWDDARMAARILTGRENLGGNEPGSMIGGFRGERVPLETTVTGQTIPAALAEKVVKHRTAIVLTGLMALGLAGTVLGTDYMAGGMPDSASLSALISK